MIPPHTGNPILAPADAADQELNKTKWTVTLDLI